MNQSGEVFVHDNQPVRYHILLMLPKYFEIWSHEISMLFANLDLNQGCLLLDQFEPNPDNFAYKDYQGNYLLLLLALLLSQYNERLHIKV